MLINSSNLGYNQGLVFDLADTLLQIDFSLIESRIYSLWPSMLDVSKKKKKN